MKSVNPLFTLLLGALILFGCNSEPGPQGPEGPEGPAGTDGSSCTVSAGDEGAATLTCDDGTAFDLSPSGEGGTCTVETSADGETLSITCPDGSSATIEASAEGGAGCHLEERSGGALFLVCEEGGEVEVRPATTSAEPTLSLLAGVTSVGTSDGVGGETRMDGALDGAFDARGDFLYFVDTFNATIRRFGVRTRRVVTLAGTPGRKGAADGVGADASFEGPRGIVLHPDGERLFIADGFNCTIRQLSLSTRTVITLAGSAGNCDAVDGPLGQARFRLTIGMVIEPSGRYIYLSDRGNNVIRRIDLDENMVETIAGELPTGSPNDARGAVDGVGAQARFSGPGGIDLSSDASTLFVNDTFNSTIRAISLEDKSATGGPELFEVSTLAGEAGSSGDSDGVGANARFQISQGLTRLGEELYVAGFNNTIRRIEPTTGLVTTVAGVAGESGSDDGSARDARFGVAFGILGSPDARHLYYMDRGNNSIRRFDTLGEEVVTVMGASEPVGWRDGAPGESRLNAPGQVWASEDGRRAYLIDEGNHVIRFFDRDADELVTIAGLPGRPGFADGRVDEARFSSPQAIWVDPEERFAYISDTGNDAIRRLELATGAVTTTLGAPSSEGDTGQDGALDSARIITPLALVGDVENGVTSRLYVTEGDTNTLRVIDLENESLTTIAGGGAGGSGGVDGVGAAAAFDYPTGLALDTSSGVLYVADQGHQLIRRVDLSDTAVTTVAGTINEPDAFDGVGVDASFDNPSQLAFLDGALYVADIGNHAIRRVDTASAEVTTVIGTIGISGGSGQLAVPLSSARLYYPVGVAATIDGLFLSNDEALMFASPLP